MKYLFSLVFVLISSSISIFLICKVDRHQLVSQSTFEILQHVRAASLSVVRANPWTFLRFLQAIAGAAKLLVALHWLLVLLRHELDFTLMSELMVAMPDGLFFFGPIAIFRTLLHLLLQSVEREVLVRLERLRCRKRIIEQILV